MTWRAASLIGVLLLCGLVIGPMLGLGFIGDDVQGSWLPGYFAWEHVSVLSDITRNIGNWLANEGRFFPISYFYAEYFFSSAALIEIEKPVQFAAVIINVATLYAVIRRLSSHRLAIMCALIFVASLQIRFWYDPIVAYFILLPVALETILLAILFWTYADRGRKLGWMVAALMVESVGLLTYEQTYGIFLAIAIGAWIRIGDVRWRQIVSALICVPVLVMSIVDLILRSRVTFGANDPYSTHLGSHAYLATVGKQLIAGLPLSYWLFRPIPAAVPTLSTLHAFVDPEVLVATALALVLGLYTFRSGERLQRRTALAFGVTGVTLWLIPAAIISLSPRWQGETILGLGYLNVYIEYVGIALTLTAGAAFGSRWLAHHWNSSSATRAVLSVGLAFIVFVTATVNRASCSAYLPIYTDGRANLDGAFRGGIADAVPDYSVIVFDDSSYLFNVPNTKYVLFSDSGRKYVVAGPSALADGSLCAGGRWTGSICTVKPNVWEYRSTVSSVDQPWVQLARMRELRRSGDAAPSVIADRWYVYGRSGVAQHMTDIGGTLQRSVNTDHVVYRYDACEGLDSLAPATATLPGVELLTGFGGPERDEKQQEFFWSTPDASLRVDSSPLSSHGNMSFGLRSLGPGTVTITSAGRIFHVTTSPQGAHVKIPIRLGADGTAVVGFRIVGGPFHVSGDPRTLGLQFDNIRMNWECQK